MKIEADKAAFKKWLKLASSTYIYSHGHLVVSRAYPRNHVGKIIGHDSGQGYLYASLSGSMFAVHRMIWFMCHGRWPKLQIDHINGERADNRIENLRLATHAENCRNARRPVTNKSGIKGVWYDKKYNKFQAYINVNDKQIWLGRFFTIEEAAAARMIAANKLHGEYARHD